MDQPNPQPKSPDAQPTVDAGGAGGTEAGKGSEAAKAAIELEKLSEALGRKITDPEEALKAVKNLHSLVGDRTIADLRKKAETYDTFEALVKGYAEEEGIKPEEARKVLEGLAKGSGPQKDERVDKVLEKMSSLEMQLQERDFLGEHPEAKSVLKELKALAAASGQTLAEAYETSALKSIVTRAAASEEREKMGSSLRPSSRTGAPSDKTRAAIERLKTDQSGDAKDNLVKHALNITTK
jgi:hypothetical protein